MFRGGQQAADGGIGESHSAALRVLDEASGERNYDSTGDGGNYIGRRRATIRGTGARAASVAVLHRTAAPSRAGQPSATPQPSAADFATGSARSRWLRRYQAGLVAIDFLAAIVAVVVAYVARFVLPGSTANTQLYGTAALVLPVAWVAVVGLNRAYEGRFIGAGPTEFERLFRSFLYLVALVAFGAYVTHVDIARGFSFVALPLALAFDLVGRYAARKWLHAQRSAGRALTSVLAVGDARAVAGFTQLLGRDRYAGMRVVGACVSGDMDDSIAEELALIDVPLLGGVDSVLDSAQFVGADTVGVVSSGQIGPEKLRWISWQLEGTDIDLVVSPGLMEVAGPRLHIRPVAGLPLLHVEQPEFTGFRRFVKSAFDKVVALSMMVMFAPLFASLWLAVRLTSRGPAFFRQERVGRDGQHFTMIKFRSMYVDAESRLGDLQHLNENADGLLFKMRDDPRVTPVGKLLRKFSLDELPQLINVITGTMSLVGPRPPLPSEVARYSNDVRRRLLVKPGVTGLWQVSGRSDLSWDESVRLDLRYVENWTPTLDLMILWKTAFAVLGRSGAY